MFTVHTILLRDHHSRLGGRGGRRVVNFQRFCRKILLKRLSGSISETCLLDMFEQHEEVDLRPCRTYIMKRFYENSY